MKAPKIDVTQIAVKGAGLGAGSVAATVIQNKLLSNVGQKIAPFVLMGIGIGVSELMGQKGKTKKNDLIGHVGDGIYAVAVREAIEVFAPGVISGIGNPTDKPVRVYGPVGTPMQLPIQDTLITVSGTEEENGSKLPMTF